VAVDFIVYIISADNKETWEYQILVSFISVLLFYIITVVLRLIFKKKQKTELVGQWYILLLVSVMSVCILFEMYKEIGLSSYGILFLSTSVLIVNLLLYVFYSSMLDRYVYMQENERLRQQMHYYNMQMNANVQNDKKVRSIRHDMKHHIREINNLANLGEIEEIKKYTSDLMGDINSSKTMFDTGNITLDGILNYYYGKFEEQNIKAAFDIIVPENMGFGAMDINIIMGNLLDNAYENAVKAKESDIKVNIKYNGNMLYISVANTFDGKVNKDKDKYLSTKGEEHGYGLENIKRITEKYGGNMKIEHNDTMFVVSIIIYIAKKNE
ncbi:ATP-binding protein, partial [Eubacterium sp. AM49-13BH]